MRQFCAQLVFFLMALARKIAPTLNFFACKHLFFNLLRVSGRRGSNPRPSAWEAIFEVANALIYSWL